MAFTDIEITGQYNNPDGTHCSGAVTFVLSVAITNTNVILQPKPYVARLVSGAFSISLPANNDPGTSPPTSQYVVIEQTDGSANREYTVTIPYNAPGGTIDISTLNTDPDSAPIFDGEGTDQYLSYVTPADLMAWMQIEAGSITNKQIVTNLQRVIDMACTWAQRYCGRPLCPTMYAERHDGWSGSDIMLKKVPFLDLISCSEYQSSGGLITLLEATPTLNNNNANVIQIDRAISQIRRAFGGYSWPRTFFPGSRNISVVYTAGFDPVPPDVWLATVEYASYWFRHTQQTLRQNVRGGANPDQLDQMNGLWQGIPYRISGLLDPFRLISIG